MNLSFNADNGVVDRAIEDLFELSGPIQHRAIVREMIIAALKAGQGRPARWRCSPAGSGPSMKRWRP